MARHIALSVALIAGGCTSAPAQDRGGDTVHASGRKSQRAPVRRLGAVPATPPPTTAMPPTPAPTIVEAARPPLSLDGEIQGPGDGAADQRGDAFWHRLAMCESGMEITHNSYVGFFQFSRGTAAKVGIDGSESYEEQRAGAIEWARRIHPHEGTTSGWPVCWWRAAA